MSRKVELVRLQGDDEVLPGPPPQSRTADQVFKKDNKRMKRPDEDTIKKALGAVYFHFEQMRACRARFSVSWSCTW